MTQMWCVQRNSGNGWRNVGILESNYPWASVWWAKQTRKDVRYRLKEVYV